MKKRILIILLVFVLATLTFPGCTTLFFMSANMDEKVDVEIDETNESLSLETSTKEPTIEVDTSAASTEPPIVGATPDEFLISSVAKYSGTPYAVVNNNVPYFTSAEITSSSYEVYAYLDSLGRCGITMACIGPDLMPTEERGEIGMNAIDGSLIKLEVTRVQHVAGRALQEYADRAGDGMVNSEEIDFEATEFDLRARLYFN